MSEDFWSGTNTAGEKGRNELQWGVPNGFRTRLGTIEEESGQSSEDDGTGGTDAYSRQPAGAGIHSGLPMPTRCGTGNRHTSLQPEPTRRSPYRHAWIWAQGWQARIAIARDLVRACRHGSGAKDVARVVQPALGVDLRVLDPRRNHGAGRRQ